MDIIIIFFLATFGYQNSSRIIKKFQAPILLLDLCEEYISPNLLFYVHNIMLQRVNSSSHNLNHRLIGCCLMAWFNCWPRDIYNNIVLPILWWPRRLLRENPSALCGSQISWLVWMQWHLNNKDLCKQGHYSLILDIRLLLHIIVHSFFFLLFNSFMAHE